MDSTKSSQSMVETCMRQYVTCMRQYVTRMRQYVTCTRQHVTCFLMEKKSLRRAHSNYVQTKPQNKI